MMNNGLISDDIALSHHLWFFANDQKKELEQNRQSHGKVKLSDHFDEDFMKKYFGD